jgi:hypothetical protein
MGPWSVYDDRKLQFAPSSRLAATNCTLLVVQTTESAFSTVQSLKMYSFTNKQWRAVVPPSKPWSDAWIVPVMEKRSTALLHAKDFSTNLSDLPSASALRNLYQQHLWSLRRSLHGDLTSQVLNSTTAWWQINKETTSSKRSRILLPVLVEPSRFKL